MQTIALFLKQPLPLFLLTLILGFALLSHKASAQLRRLPSRTGATNLVARLAEPPPSPQTKSPVDTFREMMVMSPEERAAFLTNSEPEIRRRLLAKVREYESLSPELRELRLQVTELRWYLWPMLKTAPTNRAVWLDRIPTKNGERKLVEDRLQHWDKLTPVVQKQLLENEATLRYFSELAASTDEGRSNILKSLSPERRARLEAGIQQIRKMPEAERQTMMTRFNQFFELSPAEKTKALSTLSEPERRQIEKTLRAFSQLPADQRNQCISSFDKFIRMSLAERQLFLKNAERWKLMSPQERQDWCELVTSMPTLPPFPPGFEPPTANLP